MFKEINPQLVQEMVEESTVNVVDIRDPGSYASGHIPNAVSLNDQNVKEYIEKRIRKHP